MSYEPRLRAKYQKEVAPALQKEFGYKSPMQVPRLVKISINQGLGAAVADRKIVESAVAEMSIIAGQKAVPTVSKRDISNFKLRKGMPIGSRVTLRGDRMFEFLDRLIAVALPRTRDFRGVKASGFDGRGNFTFGVKEQIIFPEIDIDKTDRIQGMDITFVTTAKTDQEAKALLKAFDFPFADKDKQ
ncbi:MAG: 50S ribosomal protein L5 [Flavobacteriales bacterium]|nr:50S ribosomal protein L5 [Flavobacteriales bacterium]MCB0783961.1 50S ribosomal protein L5 [Flavobacteriales bacterium]MCB0807951.1 50S ribosomal protein L5 [Flavobacteriales bacterium]MCB0811663.1 50S ribosomal protein L5 [Flavobacteriales bacterium]MCB0816030.1 50S ribosomal protein L5 [Flavobacteriales bacterium]